MGRLKATLRQATSRQHSDEMAAIETKVRELRHIANDISDALPADRRTEFSIRVNEALEVSDYGDAFFGSLLDGAWRARGAATLAQRVYTAREKLFGDVFGREHHVQSTARQ
jgi:hypothetical protein